MDHSKRDRIRPVVHLPIEYVLVVHDHSKAEKDPNPNIGVRQQDLLRHAVAEGRLPFPHCCKRSKSPNPNQGFWEFSVRNRKTKSGSGEERRREKGRLIGTGLEGGDEDSTNIQKHKALNGPFPIFQSYLLLIVDPDLWAFSSS